MSNVGVGGKALDEQRRSWRQNHLWAVGGRGLDEQGLSIIQSRVKKNNRENSLKKLISGKNLFLKFLKIYLKF